MSYEAFSKSLQISLVLISKWLVVMLLLVMVCLGLTESVWSISTFEVEAAASINRISIIMNGIIRIAAICAGVSIVWLGHNTMIIGVKGEFEFEGQFAKLKGSTPGLLFVLLGSLIIGWSLQTTASGEFGTKEDTYVQDSTTNKQGGLSDEKPPFISGKSAKGAN